MIFVSVNTSQQKLCFSDYELQYYVLDHFRILQSDVFSSCSSRLLHHEQEQHEAHTGDNDARYNEGQTPVLSHKSSSYQRSKDVAETGVRVPEAHNESSSSLAKPVCHYGDHTGPACGLECS